MSSLEWLALRSIRGRLILALTLGLGGLLAAVFLLLDVLVESHLYTQLDAQLLERARTVAAVIEHRHRVDSLMPEFRARGHTDYFSILDAQGQSILRSASSEGSDLQPPPHPPQHTPLFYDLILPDAHRGRAVAIASTLDADGHPQKLTVIVALEREDVDALERHLHLLLLGVLLIATLIAVTLASLIVSRGLRPLLRLSARVSSLSPDAVQPTLSETAMPSELAPLAGTLDRAFERLYAALERERRFAADVAHELRTPLAEIRTHAELARRQNTPTQLDQALRVSLRAVARMKQIIDGLLNVARYESGQAEPQPEPFELRSLLAGQCSAMRARAQARDIQLQLHATSDFWTASDPALLERILVNLLGNAVEYAPAESTIDVTLMQMQASARIEIRNLAPDLVATDVAHLGERFWRKHPEHDPQTHGGLGLALAITLARVLGLELRFRLEAGHLVATLGSLRELHGS